MKAKLAAITGIWADTWVRPYIALGWKPFDNKLWQHHKAKRIIIQENGITENG